MNKETQEVTEELLKITTEELITSTSDYLKFIIKKSGIQRDDIFPNISFILGIEHAYSTFLGDFIPAKEDKPMEIRLYIDAIIDYSSYLGVDYSSMVAKVLFTQVHNAMSWESHGKYDFLKAEQFATRIVKKLKRQGIAIDPRPKVYLDSSANAIELTARQKWIDKWITESLTEETASDIDN